MKLWITRHARDKMYALGVNEYDLARAISQGERYTQTDGFLACYTYLCVAYKIINGNIYKIKTVYVRR